MRHVYYLQLHIITIVMKKEDDYVDYLLSKLVYGGYKVDEKLAQDFLSIKERTIGPLIKLVKSDRYWHSRDEIKSLAPFTALHILSLTREKSAFDAIVYAIYNYGEEFGNRASQIAYLLANFGEEYYKEISDMLLDDRLEYWIKEPIAVALVIIAKSDTANNNGNLVKITIDLFKNTITDKEKNKETKSVLVGVLADLRDPSLIDFIKSLFENKEIDEKIISYSEIQEIYKGVYDEYINTFYIKHSPLDYFRANELFFFPKENQGYQYHQLKSEEYTFLEDADNHQTNNSKEAFTESASSRVESGAPLTKFNATDIDKKTYHNGSEANTSQLFTKTKTGRNETCPCGSGKKFKKCCL